MTKDSISVVIPAMNRATTIERAIKSAQNQTLPPSEIIIVDDGSSDDTAAISLKLAEQDSRIKLVQNETNQGAPFSRNRGASIATGNLIAFLDSDDRWLETKLEKQAALQKSTGACAVFTNFVFLRGDSRTEGKTKQKVTLEDLFGRNILGGTSSVMVQKAAFDKVGGFTAHLPSCQDWDLWLKLAQETTLYCIDEPLVEYHIDGGHRISVNKSKALDGHQHIFSVVDKLLERYPAARKKVKAQQHLRLAEVYAKNLGDRRQALKNLSQSLKFSLSPQILWGSVKLVGYLLLKS